jgi:hypothetical protein
VTTARHLAEDLVKLGIAPMLKAHGFKKRGLNFARKNGAVTHFVNVQLSSWNRGPAGSFYLNVGLVFDELCRHFDKPVPAFPGYDDCQFLVRIDKLNPALPQQFDVGTPADLQVLASGIADDLEQTFVVPLAGVDSLASFGATGWVGVVPALFHYLTGNPQEARRLVQLEADRFADRGLTFDSVAEGLRLSLA